MAKCGMTQGIWMQPASRESIYAPSHDDVQALEKYTKIDIDV